MAVRPCAWAILLVTSSARNLGKRPWRCAPSPPTSSSNLSSILWVSSCPLRGTRPWQCAPLIGPIEHPSHPLLFFLSSISGLYEVQNPNRLHWVLPRWRLSRLKRINGGEQQIVLYWVSSCPLRGMRPWRCAPLFGLT